MKNSLRVAGLVLLCLLFSIFVIACGGSGGGDSSSNGNGGGGGGIATNAMPADFVGTWLGNGTVEGRAAIYTKTLSLNGNQVVGTYVIEQPSISRIDTHNISGIVVNGRFSYAFPVSDLDIGNPDCANWDVTCAATLDLTMTTMTTDCSGTVCSSTGGQFASWTVVLSKQ